MRNISFFLVSLLLISSSCTKECMEPMGDLVQRDVPVTTFNSIIIKSGIETILKKGSTHKLIIETGENRQNNVHYTIQDEILEIEADALCITTANLAPVKVYITSPNITSIRNSGEFDITSDGILSYSHLTLLTEDYNSDYGNVGNFNLAVENDAITIISNGISNITLKGSTNHLHLGYYSGIGKFEGRHLLAQHISLYHRGENTLKVNPQTSLTGDILSLGDVISYTTPPLVEVEEHYSGRLYFEE